ncbi:MAG: S26 family signal peptidase [Candidatus Nanopelagicales bacterium]
MAKKYIPVRVLGDSMRPTVLTGDFLMVKRTLQYRIGDLVVVQLAEQQLVKRIVDANAEQVWLSGDNVKASDDSRKFGWIEKNQIVGKVLFRYWPKLKFSFKVK